MRILIVEDDPTSMLVLTASVKRLGHECLNAVDGEQAWSMLCASSVDVILSDWMMPRLSGIELCQRVRAEPRLAQTYFILLTGRSEQDEVRKGMAAGANDYLVKPWSRGDLQSRLEAAARGIAGGAGLPALQEAPVPRPPLAGGP